MKNISKEDVQNFLKTFDTETCAIIGDFYGETTILEGRKSMKTIISDAIIAVDNILESPSKVTWKNEEKIDFKEYFDYWRKIFISKVILWVRRMVFRGCPTVAHNVLRVYVRRA